MHNHLNNHLKINLNIKIFEFFQLATVSVTSMNKGDCFILCTPTQIWVYFGKFSKSCERYKALHAAGNIKAQDYSGDENDIEIIQVKQNSEQSVVEDFFAALGGGTRDLLADPPEEDDDDDEMANVEVQNVRIFRLIVVT